MNSREIVLRAVYFESPPRVPIFWSGQGKITDITEVGFKFGKAWMRAEDRPKFWKPQLEGEDEWQCVWKRSSFGRTMGQVKKHPLSKWDKLEDYSFPETRIEERFEGVQKKIEEAHANGKYVMGSIGLGFWEIYRGLRGMTAALTDIFLNKDKMEMLLDRIVNFYIEMIKEFGSLGADAISWYDDWGTQRSGMVSPKIWSTMFKPRYKRWADAAKKYGMHTFFHSCGYVYDYIPDMIDAGIDILNFNQPRLLGIDNLAKAFGGEVCFATNVDLQKTLPQGKLDEIRREAMHIINALGSFDGGLILEGWDSDILSTDGKSWDSGGYLRNYSVQAADEMYRIYLKYGRYPKRMLHI